MASQAISGVGTKFYRWNSTSTQWDQLAEVNTIGGPSMSRETIEVTSLDSEDGYREYIGGFRDGGSVNLNMNFRKDTYEVLKADFESDERQNYKIVAPNEEQTTWEFEGLVMELPPNFEAGDRITVDATIQISGRVDLYDGSSGA